ncbi:MAG: MFS transporter [Nitrospinota bacterium]
MQDPGDSRRISIYPVLLVNFIGTLGYSIILPFLIFLVTRHGGNALIYGVLGATYPAMQLIGAPILGRWSDVYGRRKVLLLSQVGTLASWLIFGAALFLPVTVLLEADSSALGKFALTLPLVVLFLARALDGLTGGNVSVANAYLADIAEEKDRNKNFGKMGISSNLGYILGPALAGVLGTTALGESLPVLAALIISLVATFVVAYGLPESKMCVLRRDPEQVNVRKVFGQEHKNCFEIKDAEPIELKEVLRLEHIPYVLLLYFLIFLGFNLFYTSFPVHAVQGMNWTITDTGTFFSVLSLMMVIVQGPVLSRLSKNCSDAFLVVTGNVILGANFLLLISTNKMIIYLAAGLFAIGNGLMWPSVLSILSRVAGEKYQGSVQGFAGSIGSLASIIGLIVGGILYGLLGTTTFLVAAGVILLASILSIRLLGFRNP